MFVACYSSLTLSLQRAVITKEPGRKYWEGVDDALKNIRLRAQKQQDVDVATAISR